jgi:hypothetical protein
MFNWLKKLFGSDVPDTPEIAKVEIKEEVKVEAKPATTKKTTAKKTTAKKASVDLDAMTKNDLLAHAKANGIKANASMKKADLIAAIKNG